MLYILYIIIIVFVVVVVMFQNRQVIVTSLTTLGALPKVPIVGVRARSGGRWVRDEMEVIAISLLKIYVRGCHVKSRWGTSVDAHEGRYFV